MAVDLVGKAGEIFGFGSWNIGIGTISTLILFVGAVFILLCAAGISLYWIYTKKIYKNKIRVFGIIGKSPALRWLDRAKTVPVGRAGDKLFYLKKSKRYLPPPRLQMGPREFWYWERSDGELINVTLEDLDERMKTLSLQFIDADMRMQRLGIEKNLQFRLKKEDFWAKYGDTIVQYGFIAFVVLMMIVLFMQWRKTAVAIQAAVTKAGEVYELVSVGNTQKPASSGSSGVIPAIALFISTKYRIWQLT